MNETLNVALLGHRFMGRAHSNAWIKAPLFFDLPAKPVLKVATGRDEAALAEFAGRWGWEETATDWQATVAREDIDIVDISLPTHLHYETAMAAIRAGKHIFCEKPFTITSAEAEELAEAADAAGVVHYLNHNYQRCPAVALAKQLIDEGRLGTIHHWRGAYQQSWLIDPDVPVDWKLRKATAGAGPHWDLSSHAVDMALFLAGEIETVHCLTKTFTPERPLAEDPTKRGAVEVDDASLMTVEFANGAVGTIETTRYATGRRNHHTFEIYGSKGAITWDLEDMNRLRFWSEDDEPHTRGWRDILATEAVHPYAAKWWPPGHVIGYEHAFVHAVADFIEAIAEKRTITPNFHDGARIIRVLEAGLRSAESGATVPVGG